jgi:fermentation-respiration switch protein FrsA (DUF1100 family)
MRARKLLPAAGLLAILGMALLFVLLPRGGYSVSGEGILSYAGRQAPRYTETLLLDDGSWSLYRVVFQSAGKDVYALLSFPDGAGGDARESPIPARGPFQVPAFVLLGGNTVSKEGMQERLGKDLNSLGFATLSLDQRGEGETGGSVPSFQEDYKTFLGGGEPVQHLMVRDALTGYDLLKAWPGIDPSRIYVAGESLGGRVAAIAAGIEPRIAGALLISTSGYGFAPQPDAELNRFLASVDPDTYVGRISPRPVAFIHSENDPVVPYSMGQALYQKAGQPKAFFTVNITDHAYIPSAMRDSLAEAVEGWR